MLSPRKSGKWLQSKRREQVEVAPGKLRIIYQAPKSSDAITASARRVIHILTTMSMHPHWSLAPRSVLCNAQNDSPGHKYKRRADAELFRAQVSIMIICVITACTAAPMTSGVSSTVLSKAQRGTSCGRSC